jgi:lipopolysaccharide export system permease protein
MRILHRYILKEMLKSLALAWAAIAGVVCFGMVLVALQQKGLGPLASLLYMALSVPGALYIALPLSVILATTLVYGRLAADNEVMACRASGIPMSSLFWPAMLLAGLAGTLSLGLAAWALPESGYAAKRLALADAERFFFSQLSNGSINLKELNFQMTVDRVVGDMLYGPTVKHRGKNGQTYCYAPYGRIEFDQPNNVAKLALWEALVVDEAHATPVRGTHTIRLELPTYVPRKEDDLPLWHLLAIQSRPELSDKIRHLREDTPPAAVQSQKDSVRAAAIAEMHGRLAMALGCLGLVLVGAGLGVYLHSGHLLTAFAVSLVPWLGSWFTTMAAVKTVARATRHPLNMVWTVWTPNAVVVLLGVVILACVVWFWAHPVRLRDRLLGRGPRPMPRLRRSAS